MDSRLIDLRKLTPPGLIWFVFLTASLAPPTLVANDLERQLNQEYKNKVVVLRNFYGGDHLQYDSGGNLVNGGTPGTWTMDGNIQVKRISIGRDSLQLDGTRILMACDPDKRKFHGLAAYQVRIDVAVDSPPATLTNVQEVLGKILDPANENLTALVPSYWKPVLEGGKPAESTTDNGALAGQPVYVSAKGGNVSVPTPTFTPDPSYSDEARRARLQGTLKLGIIIDKQGRVWDVMPIGKLLGLGLDQQAVECIRRWRFKPATRDGEPVPTRILVELTFRLR